MTRQEILKTILPAMMLAPSAHNTQPWHVTLTDTSLEIYVDWRRHLAISDPQQRELFISLGCLIMNARVAAAQAKVAATTTYFPRGEAKDAPVAVLTLAADGIVAYLASLYPTMATRRTNRHPFNGQALADSERAALQAAKEPGVHLIEEKATIKKIAAITGHGTLVSLAKPEFKGELSQWVRNNWTRQPDGMPGYAMLMPAPLSLVSHILVKMAPIHKDQAKKTEQQIATAGAVAVITSAHDDRREWLRVGQIMQQLWLEATLVGLSAAPLASAIESGPEIRRHLQHVLGSTALPQAILRLGHSQRTNLKATPRRTVRDCVRPN